MGFGAVFLLGFAGGLAGLYSLRPQLLTAAGVAEADASTEDRRRRAGAFGAFITKVAPIL
jgi:hypothetical protein